LALQARAEKEIIAAVQLVPTAAPLTPAEQHAKHEADDNAILLPTF
jgi:hypothetical protein